MDIKTHKFEHFYASKLQNFLYENLLRRSPHRKLILRSLLNTQIIANFCIFFEDKTYVWVAFDMIIANIMYVKTEATKDLITHC